MCRQVAELRLAMAAYAAGFDAALLSADDAARARDHAAAIEHMAATVKALAAARVADGPRWRTEGRRSAAHELAAATGTSVRDAHDTLELGRRLAHQPEVAAAARRGELSAAEAHLQRDHRIDWADTHFTVLDLLDVLCAHHHRLKTIHSWALVAGAGKRPFVAPSDPRHPRYGRPPPEQRGAA
jgi:hypothetical protein